MKYDVWYRPVEGGYTIVVLTSPDGVPLDVQDTDFVFPSRRAARKGARRAVKRHKQALALAGARWESETLE